MFTLLGAISILFSCNTQPTSASKEERFSLYNRGISITTDNETGCKYILTHGDYGGGITPLMLSDGTQDCERESSND